MTENQQSETPSWKTELKKSFTDIHTLLDFLELDPSRSPWPFLEKSEFPMLVTRSFAKRMKKKDWNDPLLLQVLPLAEEHKPVPGYETDAVGDLQSTVARGLIRKYRNRALLICHPTCAVHCRYCFRRQYPYQGLPRNPEQWTPAWNYLHQHPDIEEIILSGGEPLMLDNQALEQVLHQLSGIPHIKTVRIHTRMPVALPSRIESGLLSVLNKATNEHQEIITIIQANHPAELKDECLGAIKELLLTGMLVFNQSVLLKDINDSMEIQSVLSRRLISTGIVPYYLHQLDKTRGTHHFEVSERSAGELWEEMKQKLPGYALPRFVREVPGMKYKVAFDSRN
ncbi:EF-P beta-lysylation protein EpmB [Fibrobacterota bacterium]